MAENKLLPCAPAPTITVTMCEWYRNFYVYTTCHDPGLHFYATSVDGSREYGCIYGPHERYIVTPGSCPLC